MTSTALLPRKSEAVAHGAGARKVVASPKETIAQVRELVDEARDRWPCSPRLPPEAVAVGGGGGVPNAKSGPA